VLERNLDSKIRIISVRDMNKKRRDEEHEHLDPSSKNSNFFFRDILYTTYELCLGYLIFTIDSSSLLKEKFLLPSFSFTVSIITPS